MSVSFVSSLHRVNWNCVFQITFNVSSYISSQWFKNKSNFHTSCLRFRQVIMILDLMVTLCLKYKVCQITGVNILKYNRSPQKGKHLSFALAKSQETWHMSLLFVPLIKLFTFLEKGESVGNVNHLKLRIIHSY